MALLDVSFILSKGATSGAMKIDRRGVPIANGHGQIEVDASLDRHRVSMVFNGAKGGTLNFEIKQAGVSLAKGEIEIYQGQREGAGNGWFTLRGAE
jgi:hypothetical protein